MSLPQPRKIPVPERADGMRLDRFLARRFSDRSRAWFLKGIQKGEVCDDQDRPLRASARVRGGQILHLFLPGIAPDGPPPEMPPVVYEDEHVLVIDKPPGLLAHPTGTSFAWSVIGLARETWPGQDLDLVHRLDRDTSGCLVLSRDLETNRFLKRRFIEGDMEKHYIALVRGDVPWDQQTLEGPIGPKGGIIRIQMGVREDGQSARTDVTVLERKEALSRVTCHIHTGRTHQIRVHLDAAGFPVLGDRMYGVPPEVFLRTLDHGPDEQVIRAAGAPRQALHAARLSFPHPDGHTVHVEAPTPRDMTRWWAHPEVLPLDLPTDR
jgi:23S rRNA pseudouridine1911/1915/1917 synthase